MCTAQADRSRQRPTNQKAEGGPGKKNLPAGPGAACMQDHDPSTCRSRPPGCIGAGRPAGRWHLLAIRSRVPGGWSKQGPVRVMMDRFVRLGVTRRGSSARPRHEHERTSRGDFRRWRAWCRGPWWTGGGRLVVEWPGWRPRGARRGECRPPATAACSSARRPCVSSYVLQLCY